MNKYLKNILQVCLAILAVLFIIILINITIPIIVGFFHFIFSLIGPFFFGFVIAYLLVGIVDFLERHHIKRVLAVSLVFIIFIGLFTFVILTLFPVVGNELQSFIKLVPGLLDKIDLFIVEVFERLEYVPEKWKFTLGDLGDLVLKRIDLSPSINLGGIFSAFSVIFLTPVAAFYFLLEYHNIKKKIVRFLDRNNLYFFKRYLHDLDRGMGQYLKGLMVIVNILAVLASFGFAIVGLDYALLFGFLIGYLDIIPYIGPYIGGAPAVIYAFTQDFKMGILVLIICVALQIFESNVITPLVQGKTTQIKPLYIIIAVSVFGKLFGILGMIAAVPLLYFCILTVHYTRLYLRVKHLKKMDPSFYSSDYTLNE